MATPRKITVNLYVSNRYTDDLGAEPALEFIEWLQGLVAAAPEEYRGAVMIEFDDDGDYDRPAPQLSVWHERMESEEEAEAREADDRVRKERSAAEEIARAKRILAQHVIGT